MQLNTHLNGSWTGIEAYSELNVLVNTNDHNRPERFSVIEQESLRVLHNRVNEDADNIYAELVSAYKLGERGQ